MGRFRVVRRRFGFTRIIVATARSSWHFSATILKFIFFFFVDTFVSIQFYFVVGKKTIDRNTF